MLEEEAGSIPANWVVAFGASIQFDASGSWSGFVVCGDHLVPDFRRRRAQVQLAFLLSWVAFPPCGSPHLCPFSCF